MRRLFLVLLALVVASAQTVLLVQPASAVSSPTVSSPADGSTIADRTPLLAGTWDPSEGGDLVVQVDGIQVYSEGAGIPGGAPERDWEYQLDDDLAYGVHTVTASFTSSPGDTGSASSNFTIAAPGPGAPLLFDPTNGALTGNQVTAVGVIADGGTVPTSVRVFVDGTYVGNATLNGVDWSLALPRLGDGSHSVYAVARDDGGNDSDRSNTSTFTVDGTAPATPVITAPEDGYYENQNVTFRGTGEPGARLTIIYEYGTFDVTVSPSGEWEKDAQSLELGDGTHSFRVRQTDEAGNVSPTSDEVTYTYDATAPEAPSITVPATGDTLSEDTFDVLGRGEIGATVTVVINGQSVGTALVDSDGDWRLNGVSSRPNGSREITATQADRADNESPVSNTVTITVELTPAAPVIEKPTDGSVTNGNQATQREITGTAEAGSTVRVLRDGVQIAEVTAGQDGSWGYVPPDAFPDGTYELTATATNAAGTSQPSAPVTQTYDTVPPAAPVIETPTPNAFVRQVVLTGTTEPGARVFLTLAGQVVEGPSATADSNGRWTIPLPGIPDGTYALGALARDTAGNPGPSSAPVTFTVDTVAPSVPEVSDPSDGQRIGNRLTIVGLGEPNATITVRVGTTVVGTTVVDSAGEWQLVADELDEGDVTISVTQTDRAGNVSGAVEVNVVVDTAAPAAPVVTAPPSGTTIASADPVTFTGTGEPGATVTLRFDDGISGTGDREVTAVVDSNGDWEVVVDPLPGGSYTVSATQTDIAGNASEPSASRTLVVDGTAPAVPVVTSPAPNDEVGALPTLEGNGEPGATVTVTLNGVLVGTTTVDGAGTWSLTTDELPEGNVVLEIVQTDPAGNVSPALELRLTVDDTAPAAPTVAEPVEGETFGTERVAVSGTGEAGATVIVRRGSVTVGTATVSNDGTWELVTSALPEGTTRLYVSQRDRAGNGSPTTGVRVVVDTAAPAAPVLTAPANGATIAPTAPVTFTGTGEAGATVTLRFDDGDPTTVDREVTVVVGGDGGWETVAEPLPEGMYTVTAIQTDVAGNASERSGNRSLVVDGTAPSAPVVTSPAANAYVGAQPTLEGTGEAGATVTVRVSGALVGTATVDGAGRWSLTTDALSEGDVKLAIVQTDTGGNVSPTLELPLTVDFTPPAVPAIDVPTQSTTTLLTLTGTGEPGSQITIYLDGVARSESATVDGEGKWTLDLVGLPAGSYSVTATATDEAGNTSAPSAAREIRVVADPVIDEPVDGQAFTIRRPTFTGTGEPGSTIVVRGVTAADLAAVIQSLEVAPAAAPGDDLATGVVDADGTWTATPTTDLELGIYSVVAEQAQGGVTSGLSEVVDFAVVTGPVITSPATGSEQTGSFEMCGTGEPGFTVQIVDLAAVEEADATVYGETEVGADGTWCVDVEMTSDGSYRLVARQGLDGEFETASDPIDVTVTGAGGSGGDDSGGGTSSGGSSSGDNLASTGGPAATAGLAGLVLVGAGGLTMHLARRRRLGNRRG